MSVISYFLTLFTIGLVSSAAATTSTIRSFLLPISFLFLSYSDDISYANIRVENERGRPALNSLSDQSFFSMEEFIQIGRAHV
jgi:hypothetical protein